MIRPVDMQVALNALPDQGARVQHETAATQYRQVQNLGASRDENLNRPHRVTENAETYAATFRGVEQSGDSARREEVRERVRRRNDSEDGDRRDRGAAATALGEITYEPMSLHAPSRRTYSEEGAGHSLDFTA